MKLKAVLLVALVFSGECALAQNYVGGYRGGEDNAAQFQRNMGGIVSGVQGVAGMAEDGRRAASSAAAIPDAPGQRRRSDWNMEDRGDRGERRGWQQQGGQRGGNMQMGPNGMAIQDRGQSSSDVMVNGRRYRQGY